MSRPFDRLAYMGDVPIRERMRRLQAEADRVRARHADAKTADGRLVNGQSALKTAGRLMGLQEAERRVVAILDQIECRIHAAEEDFERHESRFAADSEAQVRAQARDAEIRRQTWNQAKHLILAALGDAGPPDHGMEQSTNQVAGYYEPDEPRSGYVNAANYPPPMGRVPFEPHPDDEEGFS